MKRDEIALRADEAQLLSTWGKAIAGQPDLPAFVQSLAARETALVRLDVPLGQLLEQMPVAGRIGPFGTNQPDNRATPWPGSHDGSPSARRRFSVDRDEYIYRFDARAFGDGFSTIARRSNSRSDRPE